jgi:hypothetical protein
MATIMRASTRIRTIEKTIAFTGAAGLGLLASPIPIFTLTGRSVMLACFGTCSENFVSAGAGTLTLQFSDGLAIIPTTTATDLVANDIWVDATPAETVGAALAAAQKDIVVNGTAATSIIIAVGTADVTDGTLTISLAYQPISSDANVT